MYHHVAEFFFRQVSRRKPQGNQVKFNVRNTVGYLFNGYLRAADARIIRKGEYKNLLHNLADMPVIYSLRPLCGTQPSALALVISRVESMRLPCRSGSIFISPPNICATSSTEHAFGDPRPNSSPSPRSPTNTKPPIISLTWVKFRFCVPGETTVRACPASLWRLKVSMRVPYSFAGRSRGPYTL